MNANKIIYGGKVVLDLTGDTVVPSQVLKGNTFHDRSGVQNEGTCDFDSNTMDATVMVAEMLINKTAYANGKKLTGTMPNNSSTTKTISTLNEKATIPFGYHDGSGYVSISSTEKAKIKAENIRKGVSILGVVGSLEESDENPEPTRSVTPSTSEQSITPAAGYTCLREVVVAPIPYSETQNEFGGITVTIG